MTTQLYSQHLKALHEMTCEDLDGFLSGQPHSDAGFAHREGIDGLTEVETKALLDRAARLKRNFDYGEETLLELAGMDRLYDQLNAISLAIEKANLVHSCQHSDCAPAVVPPEDLERMEWSDMQRLLDSGRAPTEPEGLPAELLRRLERAEPGVHPYLQSIGIRIGMTGIL